MATNGIKFKDRPSNLDDANPANSSDNSHNIIINQIENYMFSHRSDDQTYTIQQLYYWLIDHTKNAALRISLKYDQTDHSDAAVAVLLKQYGSLINNSTRGTVSQRRKLIENITTQNIMQSLVFIKFKTYYAEQYYQYYTLPHNVLLTNILEDQVNTKILTDQELIQQFEQNNTPSKTKATPMKKYQPVIKATYKQAKNIKTNKAKSAQLDEQRQQRKENSKTLQKPTKRVPQLQTNKLHTIHNKLHKM